MSYSVYPFDGALAFYTFDTSVSNPLTIPDNSGNGRDGTLSGSAIWGETGVQLNGTQTVTVPNSALVAAGQDFTIFISAQYESAFTSSSPSVLFDLDSVVKITLDEELGLSVLMGSEGYTGSAFLAPNVPFAIIMRFNYSQNFLDVRVAQHGTTLTTNGGIVEKTIQEAYEGKNGIIGENFIGSLLTFAIYNEFRSNGTAGELFKYAHTLLFNRNTVPGFHFTTSAFQQQGAFQ